MKHKILQNFAAKNAAPARYAAEIIATQTPDYCRTDCGLFSDTFNVSIPLSDNPSPALYAAMVGYFSVKSSPMALWLWDFLPRWRTFLDASPLTMTETNLGMCAWPDDFRPPAESLTNLTLRRAKTHADVMRFADVLASVFGDTPEAQNVKQYFAVLSQSGFFSDNAALLYLGESRGQAVCAGAAFPYRDTVGIYDIATRPQERGQGYGTAMFSHILLDIKKHFHCLCVLQASAAGAGIYRRAGFKSVCEVSVYENRDLLF